MQACDVHTLRLACVVLVCHDVVLFGLFSNAVLTSESVSEFVKFTELYVPVAAVEVAILKLLSVTRGSSRR